MKARGVTMTMAMSLCALTCGLALWVASAQATVTHEYRTQITEVPVNGPPPAKETVQSPGPLTEPNAMTVDSGELYVAEGLSNSRLDKFDASSGAFVSQLPQIAPPIYDLHQGVAVGHATGETEVYVGGDESRAGEPQGLVAVLGAAGTLQAVWKGADTPSNSFGCLECGPRGDVAVDNDTTNLNDWAQGDVYVVAPKQGVVDVFKPEAEGKEKYVTQLTGPEPPGTMFVEPQYVAVDQSNGDVLVGEGNVVDVFEPTLLEKYTFTRQLTGTPGGEFNDIRGLAVDGGSGDIYVLDSNPGVVDQFSSAGAYLGHLVGTPTGPFAGAQGLAVDPTSHYVYVGDGDGVDIFGPSIVVPDVKTEPASNLKARSATLNGMVNPDEAGTATCQFEWGTSTSFGKVAPCAEAIANGNASVAVYAALVGLQPDTTYYYRLQATNSSGTNPGEADQDREVTTPGPGIHNESAVGVASTSATLTASIDPHGAPTSYYFQYGTDASYGVSLPVPPGLEVGSGEGDLTVSLHLQALAASTTYHYRVVAVSEANGEPVTVRGPDEALTTQAAGGESTLADGRSWEMVSPPDKHGSEIKALSFPVGTDIQASVDGSAITYAASGSFSTDPAGSRSPEETQIVSARRAPGKWESSDVTTPHTEGGSELGSGSEYKMFSSDLSLGLVEPAGDTPLPPLPPGSEKTVYLRGPNGEYRALVTSANVPPGTKFGGGGESTGGISFSIGTPDLSHLLIESRSEVPLTATPGDHGGNLYEWADGQMQVANVLPNGEMGGERASGLELAEMQIKHMISTDGSRVVFGRRHVYLRDIARHETVQVDAAQGVAEPQPEQAASQYVTANSEGSRVFFTSPRRLTADSTAPLRSLAVDLYEFELTSAGGEPLAGRLRDLTVDANPGESADVVGVIGTSDDGSYVYFVANGVLGDAVGHGVQAGTCARGEVAGAVCNLYVERYDQGVRAWMPPQFVSTLAGRDRPSWQLGTNGTSRVSPDGHYLAFMSERSLTGYENHDANSGVADEEVFLYDATKGSLACASCNPSGARPSGIFEGNEYPGPLVDNASSWPQRWLAGNIPGWTGIAWGYALYQSRYLASSGRLFFNSADALVPADVNGKEDVYEYEPAGVGSCSGPAYGQSASVVFSASADGCVALVSSGTSAGESAFMDASETGGDVFFLTLSRLTPQDYDTGLDLYDAHECTADAPCASPAALAPPPCTTGDACKAAPTPQPTSFGAPSSETFSGAGNIAAQTTATTVKSRSKARGRRLAKALKSCRRRYRGSKGKRLACESQARRRHGAKRSRVVGSLPVMTRRQGS